MRIRKTILATTFLAIALAGGYLGYLLHAAVWPIYTIGIVNGTGEILDRISLSYTSDNGDGSLSTKPYRGIEPDQRTEFYIVSRRPIYLRVEAATRQGAKVGPIGDATAWNIDVELNSSHIKR